MRLKFFLLALFFLLITSGLVLATFKIKRAVSVCHQLPQLPSCLNQLRPFLPTLKRLSPVLNSPPLTQLLNLYEQSTPLQPFLNKLLGIDQPFTYLVLLQNDTELRTHGGFFGSYAVLTLDLAKPSLRFQDIYVPDGQLPGHVDSPQPLQDAFHIGGYHLRDSDWDPDFLKAATAIRWFFDKGGEIKPDLLITLNLSTIQDILTLIGPLKVPGYDLSLSADNAYTLLQTKVQTNFFPGSTQKKDILAAAGRAFFDRLTSLPLTDKLTLIDKLILKLKQKNLLLNALDPDLQSIFETQDWAGKLIYPSCYQQGCLLDTYLLIEANLGANKANCCLTRQTTHTIAFDKSLIHQVKLELTNNSKSEPTPPDFFGGSYLSYLRFYIPSTATNISLTATPNTPSLLNYPPLLTTSLSQATITPRGNFQEIGFFHFTRFLSQSQVNLSYELPLTAQSIYELHLLKQQGLPSSPQIISLNGQTTVNDLSQDFTYTASLYSN